jgi:hypothetical protein
MGLNTKGVLPKEGKVERVLLKNFVLFSLCVGRGYSKF